MTITFDRVGVCTRPGTYLVEGYSPANGMAHGSLDVTVRVCGDCHQTLRQQLWDCGMTPYSREGVWTNIECGDRTVFSTNKYVTMYAGNSA
jgi:hypothetical protein